MNMKLCFGCSITPPGKKSFSEPKKKTANRNCAGARPAVGLLLFYFRTRHDRQLFLGNPAHTRTPRLSYCGTPQDHNEGGAVDGARGGWGGGGVSEELQWTALQQMTAQTEKEKTEERRERNKKKNEQTVRKGFRHKYAETRSRSLKKNNETGAKSSCKNCQACCRWEMKVRKEGSS